jgi:hypothetical protein
MPWLARSPREMWQSQPKHLPLLLLVLVLLLLLLLLLLLFFRVVKVVSSECSGLELICTSTSRGTYSSDLISTLALVTSPILILARSLPLWRSRFRTALAASGTSTGSCRSLDPLE